MSIVSTLRSARDAAAMVWSVSRNTGVMPTGHRCMVLIEPTSVCNLSCPLCPTGTKTLERQNRFITLELFERIVELTAPAAQGFVLNLFGEPTFHPQIGRIFEKTRHLPVWLSTNLSYGAEAAQELASWEHLHVICSVDTLDPEEYPAYRIGGDWDKVMRNLEILAKGRCQVHPQFLVKEGEYAEADFVDFAASRGIPPGNVIIKTKMENFRLDPTDRPVPGRCHSAYADLYFNCDGYLLPCCNNVRSDVFMGHVDEFSSLNDIRTAAKAVRVRRALARDKNVFTSCGQCNGLDFWTSKFPEYKAAARAKLLGRTADPARPQKMQI